MPITPPPDRAVYRNSGHVRPISLVWGAVTGSLLSLIVSGAMMVVGVLGFYLIALVPMLAGMAVGGLAMLVVYQSHCRNWKLAGVLGFGMGVLAYLGYYHLDMLRHAGYENWYRIDATPSYIQLRWANDVVGKVGRGGGAPNFELNAILWVLECAAMGIFGAILAMRAGGKPYAESARCWMHKCTFECPPGSSVAIAQALASRTHAELEGAMVDLVSNEDGFNRCELWACPAHLDPDRQEPVFLSMTEHGPANKDGNRNEVQAIVHWQLDPGEVAIAVDAFPRELGPVFGSAG
jgi:hypothetical protein